MIILITTIGIFCFNKYFYYDKSIYFCFVKECIWLFFIMLQIIEIINMHTFGFKYKNEISS